MPNPKYQPSERLARDLADVGLDPTQPELTYEVQTRVDNGRLFVEVNQLRERVADLERDVAYWSQRHDLYKALWMSLPRRLRARWCDRYNRAHPLTVEQLR
jgi:hypothetical protein